MSKHSDTELKNVFTYHPATPDQAGRYEQVRAGCLKLARLIVKLVPNCPEAAEALAKVRAAMFLANAGIACRDGAKDA